MLNSFKRISKIIETNGYAILLNERKIHINANILFDNLGCVHYINYNANDIYCTDHSRILSSLKVNAATQSSITDNEQLPSTRIGKFFYIAKRAFKFFKKLSRVRQYIIKHRYNHIDFQEKEIDILIKLEKISKKPAYVVINHLNYACKEDLLFYQKLLESDYLSKHSNLKLIFISDEIIINNINLFDQKVTFTLHIEDTEFIELLRKKINLPEISDDRLLMYLNICNYNIELLKSILESTNLECSDNNEYIFLFEQRIKQILEAMPDITALEFGAIIGISFDAFSISEISEIQLENIVAQAKEASDNKLILKLDGEYNFQFVDEIVRKTINFLDPKKAIHYLKYAQHINAKTPFEYLRISNQYYNANNILYTIAYYMLYLLDCRVNAREPNDVPDYNKAIETHISSNIILKSVYKEFQRILDLYRDNNLPQNEYFDFNYSSDYDIVTNCLQFSYLYLLYISKSIVHAHDYETLAENLKSLYEFFEEKNILGVQLQIAFMLLDIFSYRVNAKEKVPEILVILESLESKISKPNSLIDAKTLLKYIRKIASVDDTLAGYNKMRTIYGAYKDSNTDLYNVEFYKFLSDFLATALYNGKWTELYPEVINDIENMLSMETSCKLPKVYKPKMNIMLYRLYNNNLPMNEIKSFVSQEYKQFTTNSIMYQFDVASFALYIGNTRFAEFILSSLYERTLQNPTCFYDYCINANLTALYILKHDYAKAKAHNDHILNTDYNWYEPFITTMKKRAMCFSAIIKEERSVSSRQLWTILDKEPLGEFDNVQFLGKGILFSELMFYRE